MNEKCITLLGEIEQGWSWSIIAVTQAAGTFHAKGGFRLFEVKEQAAFSNGKKRYRDKDRQWFKYQLGKEYMKQFEVHHEWDKGATCYLLTSKEHAHLEGRLNNG